MKKKYWSKRFKVNKRRANSLLVVLSLILLIVLVVAFVDRLTDRSDGPAVLPEAVTQWRPLVLAEMEKQGLSQAWIDVMMAQLMQESGGRHVDIFQCSESKYGVPGMIESEEESIEQAVYYWLKLIDRAEELGIEPSRENILQSYNMGIGYLDHLKEHRSDTTPELAALFSETVHQGGGDPNYVDNVLRYLEMAINSREESY
ncbi:MAG TPA: hypothetical protein GXZ74_09015 [Tissierellia bacterium]|nr:hypothetical protein [Tissierellia bacterium]